MRNTDFTPLKTEKGKLLLLGALAVFAVLLLIIGERTEASSGKVASVSEETEENQEQEATEQELAEILSSIKGVGKVNVNICYEGEVRKTYVFNETSEQVTSADGDSENSASKELVLDETGKPVVAEAVYPEILGVLVSAEGAEKDETKQLLLDAVASYLDIGKNRIEITPLGE